MKGWLGLGWASRYSISAIRFSPALATLQCTVNPPPAVRSFCAKDVVTINKQPISSSMTEGLYQYLLEHTREPAVLQQLRVETAKLQGARMQVTPDQGQFMALLARLLGVKRYLEVGVFTGYSLIATSLSLPGDGLAVALDRDDRTMAMAREFADKAGVLEKVDFREGAASDTLETVLADFGEGSFDLAFIDADKRQYKSYYEKLLKLVRPGGLIMIDNVLWSGKVADEDVTDKATEALRDLNQELLRDSRVDFTIVPVGDGIAMCRKRG